MDKSNYDPILNLLAFVPLVSSVLVTMLTNSTDGAGDISWFFAIIIFALSIYVYIKQNLFLKLNYLQRLKNQRIFIGIALIAPLAIGFLGDLTGRSRFNDWNDNSSVWLIFIVAAVVGWLALNICLIGNALFVITNGVSQLVEVLGIIIRVLCYLAIVTVSYFLYSLVYSLHDPSTE